MQLRIKRTSRVKPDSAYQRKAARKITSQRGEDGIIEKMFGIMGTAKRYCVEFRAWDGKLYSNTWNPLNNEGWGGLQIEGSAEKFAELQAAYAGNDTVTTLNRLVAPAGPDGFDAVLAEVGAPRDLDLLSIDVDGLDWHIWIGMNAFAPRLVVVEFNPSVPNDILFV